LVTADECSEMHLVNPVTSEQISLPSVITRPPSTHSLSRLRDYLFHKALLFYDTSAAGYIVVLIHNPLRQLSFARLGDEKWTWLPPHDLSGTVVTTKIIMDRNDKYGLERVYIVQAPWGDLLLVRRPEVSIKAAPAEHGHACAVRADQATFGNRTWRISIY
ncbi:hypothetical protein BAE44_0019147, partial [Dichanthelium oligosanthes]